MTLPLRCVVVALLEACLAAQEPTVPAPELRCRMDREQNLLVLEVTGVEDRSLVTVIASERDHLLPPRGSMPAVLATDLVLAAGQVHGGRLRIDLSLLSVVVPADGLFLQAVVATPQGMLRATRLQQMRRDHDAACGVRLAAGAVVYSGHPCNSTRPGTFDFDAVRATLPEWRLLQAEGVRPGSARHRMLVQALHERVLQLARKAASDRGCDLVVRASDLADAGSLPVLDLTAAMGGNPRTRS